MIIYVIMSKTQVLVKKQRISSSRWTLWNLNRS